MARESFLDELDWQTRSICSRVLQCEDFDSEAASGVDDWLEAHQHELVNWKRMIAEIRSSNAQEYAMYAVAVRGLLELARDIGG